MTFFFELYECLSPGGRVRAGNKCYGNLVQHRQYERLYIAISIEKHKLYLLQTNSIVMKSVRKEMEKRGEKAEGRVKRIKKTSTRRHLSSFY